MRQTTGNAVSSVADIQASTPPAASRMNGFQVLLRSEERCHSTPVCVWGCNFYGVHVCDVWKRLKEG